MNIKRKIQKLLIIGVGVMSSVASTCMVHALTSRSTSLSDGGDVSTVFLKKDELFSQNQKEDSVIMVQSKDNRIRAELDKAQKEEIAAAKEARKKAAQQSTANVPEGAAKEAFQRIVSEKGLSQSEIDGWAYIIYRESGWNTTARNQSSGAYGLPQSLPGHKMASHGSDWQTNPYTQLSWMYDYMIGRYGSIQGAVNFWNRNHWY